jgi:hypothetical protein
MRPLEKEFPADIPAPSFDALVWPAPVTDAEILWLEQAEPVISAPAVAAAGTPPVGLSLTQLLGAGTSMEWHDAVAIVSQLAHDVLADKKRPPVGALPAADAIRLDADGRLLAELDRSSTEPLTLGFGRVLQMLLQDKPAPANLRLLAWRATSEAGATLTVDEIAGELARWERPGRLDKLKSLYERGCAAGPLPPTEESLEPAETPPTIAERSPIPPVAERPSIPTPLPLPAAATPSKRQIALMIAGAIVCIAIGGAGVWLFEQRGNVAEAPAADAALKSEILLDIDLPAPERPAARRTGRDAQPADESDRPRAQRGSGLVENSQRTTRPERTSDTISSPSSTPNKLFANASARSAAPIATVPPVADAHLYTSSDPGVIEPVLVKPYLPVRPRPGISESALGVIEVVVDAHGLVESVHLKSPANRYREKWWLFTAKDWRFDPARRNGMPVRFLKRILLTDLNIAEPQ